MSSIQGSLFDIIDSPEEEVIEFRYLITSYGADYPVDSIINRIESGAIFVPPFQRRFVWNLNEASKFIESLIIGLPVPGIFLSKEAKTNRLLIVDGQQRLLTLHGFYNGLFKGREFRLKNVQSDLEGKNYKDLSSADQLRFNDAIIHATVVRQDEPDDSDSSVYQIFERLNSGGRTLTPQEIRACIYYGDYNELLNDLVKFPEWREIFGPSENARLKEQELILRFVSLFYRYQEYEKPLKGFLNQRMAENRALESHSKAEIEKIFKATIIFINKVLGKSAFRLKRGINTAVFDSVMVGIAMRLLDNRKLSKEQFENKYSNLLKSEEYLQYISAGTSDEASLKGRINLAIKEFADI